MKFVESEIFIDKSNWIRGEWDSEPDKAYWLDADTKLPCLIVRGPLGALCGYVGVGEKHPKYEKDYPELYDVEVHGGLTYSHKCQGKICHNEPNDHIWWFGFDCAHFMDFCPRYSDKDLNVLYGTKLNQINSRVSYKNLNYVILETKTLAKYLGEFFSDKST